MKENVLIILPAYNQEKNIPNLIKEVKKYAEHVVLVADGSTDNTAQVSLRSGARVLKPLDKRGKGNAVIRGINFSKKLNPEVVILMDSDGQHNPEEIPEMIKGIREGNDMVIGSRFLGTIKTSNINKVGNIVLNMVHFLLTFRWVSDVESGFRAFKADKLYTLEPKAPHYEIESDMLLEAVRKKLSIKEIPIKIVKEEKGITLLDGFKIFNYIFKKRLTDILK